MNSKKIFFISDLHLGIDHHLSSLEREKKVVSWLDSKQDEMKELYLVGDIFDHWFEYKSVVPKGYVRILGKFAELRDADIPINFFTGNHDMWMFRYLTDELGIPIYRQPIAKEYSGKKILIGHGDGLGPGDHGYKFIKKIFSHPLSQWAYARLHPNFGLWLMKYFSGKSRDSTSESHQFLGADKEWLIQYCESCLSDGQEYDYFVFGHRHLPIKYSLSNNKSVYFNLGDWLEFFTYGVFDGKEMQLYYADDSPVVAIN